MSSYFRKPPFPLFTAVAAAILLFVQATPAAGAGGAADHRFAARTIRFSHADEQFLRVGQSRSSVAYVPEACGEAPLPVLALLHGVNESRTLYPWFGGSHDLRPRLDSLARISSRKFIVAAPSQTKDVWLASATWSNFSPQAFIDDLSAALPSGCEVDREAVILAGHSGAGCNPEGGLATAIDPDSAFQLAGLAFVDTCFDVKVATQVARRRSTTKLWILWQNQTWPRTPQPFLDRLNVPGRPPATVTAVRSAFVNAHVGAMYSAVEEIVKTWIIGETPDATPALHREPLPAEPRTHDTVS
jgi:hypothetical protein